jgi:hypothetical protein
MCHHEARVRGDHARRATLRGLARADAAAGLGQHHRPPGGPQREWPRAGICSMALVNSFPFLVSLNNPRKSLQTSKIHSKWQKS